MKTHGKKYRKVAELVTPGKSQDLKTALEFLKKHTFTKFDQTAELAFHLGVDVTKSDQSVRGTVSLPHGTGKKVRVVVFATGAAADAARAAGADDVGYSDLLEKVKGGWTDFDIAIATTEAMLEVRKLGKVLGPRGLMPNPRTGTVSDDTASAVRQFKAGRLEFKMDKGGNVMVPFGKLSFELEKLLENARSVIQAVASARPSAAKGIFIKRLTVTSTMGPGLAVESREYTTAAA